MALVFRCPSCRATVHVPEALAGREARCPCCAAGVRVPDSGGNDETGTSDRAHAVASPPRETGQRLASGRDRPDFLPCPRCGSVGARRVYWTSWGSYLGPALLTHVRCPRCGFAYNGRTGKSNVVPATLFVAVPTVLVCGILAWIVARVWNYLN